MQTCQLSYSWPHMHSYYQHGKLGEGSLPHVLYAHAFFECLDRAIMIVSKKISTNSPIPKIVTFINDPRSTHSIQLMLHKCSIFHRL